MTLDLRTLKGKPWPEDILRAGKATYLWGGATLASDALRAAQRLSSFNPSTLAGEAAERAAPWALAWAGQILEDWEF